MPSNINYNPTGAKHIPPVVAVPSTSATRSWFRSFSTPVSGNLLSHGNNEFDPLIESQVVVKLSVCFRIYYICTFLCRVLCFTRLIILLFHTFQLGQCTLVGND